MCKLLLGCFYHVVKWQCSHYGNSDIIVINVKNDLLTSGDLDLQPYVLDNISLPNCCWHAKPLTELILPSVKIVKLLLQ